MDLRKMKARCYELIGKQLRQAHALLIPYIVRRYVERKSFWSIEEEASFAIVSPWSKVLVSHSVVVNREKYVSFHLVSAIYSLIQTGCSAQASYHEVCGRETGVYQLFVNALR